MLSRKFTLIKAYLIVCLCFGALPFVACYEPAHAQPQRQHDCMTQQDVSFQSHFMIWQACVDED